MQNQEIDQTASGIDLLLEIPGPVVTGLSVLAFLYVSNRAGTPITVSARLNLMEGDVQFLVTGPDGAKKTVFGAGGQPDTQAYSVTLEPGQQIASAVNLLYTSVGPTVSAAGPYTLQAVYFPSPQMERVYSNEVRVTARSPQTESERAAAALLENDNVKRAIVIPGQDTPDEDVRELASRPDTLDGKLASRIVAAADGKIAEAGHDDWSSTPDPVVTAMELAALSTPFSNVGSELKTSYAAFLNNASNDEGENTRKALAILTTEPY